MSFYIGLPDKLLKFFRDNPDEVLTYDDVCKKYDVTRRRAFNTVNNLCKRGLLETAPVTIRPIKRIVKETAT